MLTRRSHPLLEQYLQQFPAVGIIGPRQVGKSTLAKALIAERPGALYLDLERPSDRAKLTDPEAFFAVNRGRLVCLDEIQRLPELFATLRSILDDAPNQMGQVLLLGSAAPELLRGASETLAGRIAYLELSPLALPEVAESGAASVDLQRSLWLRGGFPRSFLAKDYDSSFVWREQFVRTPRWTWCLSAVARALA